VEDPYLQLGDSEDGSEAEDMTFRDTDLVILGARNEDDVSHLEVWAKPAFAAALLQKLVPVCLPNSQRFHLQQSQVHMVRVLIARLGDRCCPEFAKKM